MPHRIKASEVLQRYATGEREFSRANLRGQSFKGQNLAGADFTDVDICSADFTHAILTAADSIMRIIIVWWGDASEAISH